MPTSAKTEEIRRALLEARAGAKTRILWPGGEARVFGERLYLMRGLPAASAPNYRARLDTRTAWAGPEGEVRFERAGGGPGLPESWLDAGLELRFRTGGERFRPSVAEDLAVKHRHAAGIDVHAAAHFVAVAAEDVPAGFVNPDPKLPAGVRKFGA